MSDLVQAIPVNAIVDPQFNSRIAVDVERAKAIGLSMQTEGQLQPIRVEDITALAPNGEAVEVRYRLVFGGTRLAGARIVGMPEILAIVVPPMDEVQQVLTNGIENVQRKDLSTYELARLCDKLRSMKLKLAEVGAKLGISQSHVSNLAATYAGLPNEIKELWAKGDEAASIDFLRFLLTKEDDKGKKVGRTPEEMLTLYKERQQALAALTAELEDDEDKAGKFKAHNKKNSPYKVPKDKYRLLLKALKGSPQIASDVARYLVGDIEKIRGLKLEQPETKTTTTKGAK